MERWYIIKGDGIDEVCLLSQKWGSFIHPVERTIRYSSSKTSLCDEEDKFSLTHPAVTNFDLGFYKIYANVSGTILSLMNSI